MIECAFENGKKAVGGLRHITVGIIAFNKNNQVLLIKRSKKYSRPGKYALPGGFVGRDEIISDAALRELKEETGIDGYVENLFHINDYPNRPNEDRQNVDFIFLAKVNSSKFIDNDEVDSINWFDKVKIPSEEEFAFDHRGVILKAYEYSANKFNLPLIGRISNG